MKLTLKRESNSSGAHVTDVIHPEFIRALPRVNLLPSHITEAISVRRIRRAFIAGFLALLVAGTALWLLQNGEILTAQTELNAAQAENTALSAQVQALQPVEQLYSQITTQEEFITGALTSEALTSQVLKSLQDVAGSNVEITNVGITYTGIPNPATSAQPEKSLNTCPNSDPFNKDITIGCLTFSARTKSRGDVSSFLARAARPPFVGPYVTETRVGTFANGSPAITFSGTAGISPMALKTKLTTEELAALVTAAVPKPAATTAPETQVAP